MKSFLTWLAPVVLCLPSPASGADEAPAGGESTGPFRSAAAAVDITPENGTPMAGYYSYRAVAGVIDPIYAKAIVVEQAGLRAAVVALDLSSTTRPLVVEARKLIQERCGIPGDRVIICATHTHSGPQLPRGTLMDEITRVNEPAGARYVAKLPELIARSVETAVSRLAPAKLSAVVGRAENLAFNRRVLRDGESKAVWQPSKIDPTRERPAGPVDPDVGLLVFDSATTPDRPLASLVNFAMHPTSVGSGLRISADYPGVLTRLMSDRYGDDMTAVFINGCCGNINHTNYLDQKRPTTKEIGTRLADAVDAVWASRRELATYAPRSQSEVVQLERRRFSDEQVAEATEIARRMTTERLGTIPMAEAVCILQNEAQKGRPVEAEVQTIALGDDVAIVALPGEIFVELGIAVKAASPFRHTLIAELAGGSIGYVPNAQAYPQGSYEVISSRVVAGSGEKLARTAIEQLRKLKAAR